MKAFLSALAAAWCAMSSLACAAPALRAEIVVDGPAIRLGDVLDDAGPNAGRAFAPAPAPGRSAQVPVRVIAAAAASAGVAFTPPEGVANVVVSRRAAATGAGDAAGAGGEVAVRRGEVVLVLYRGPGVSVSTRMRAQADAAVGDVVRLSNRQSNRVIEAIVTGPGVAATGPDATSLSLSR